MDIDGIKLNVVVEGKIVYLQAERGGIIIRERLPRQCLKMEGPALEVYIKPAAIKIKRRFGARSNTQRK